MAVIRGESCFEKNAFEDTEKSTRPPKLEFLKSQERISREIFEISKKKFLFCFEDLLTAFLFHGKLSCDNSTYFKLYGNRKSEF